MKLKYPAEAFALAIVIFSAGMKASFTAGILVILTVVFAEFLKNLLEDFLPDWSLKACVLIATASLSASAFTLGFGALSIPVITETWLLTLIIGLFAAKYILEADLQADYGELFWESAVIWGCWILLAAVREFMGVGKIFGIYLRQMTMQSKAFQEVFFGFLTAGLVLAFTNGILKKRNAHTNSLLLILPIVILARPFTMESVSGIAGMIWTMIVPVIMFISVRKTLRFTRTGRSFRGLPAELLSAGFIYMILSIY